MRILAACAAARFNHSGGEVAMQMDLIASIVAVGLDVALLPASLPARPGNNLSRRFSLTESN
jgi:hypothetical protein